jgi:hypothetical protein
MKANWSVQYYDFSHDTIMLAGFFRRSVEYERLE